MLSSKLCEYRMLLDPENDYNEVKLKRKRASHAHDLVLELWTSREETGDINIIFRNHECSKFHSLILCTRSNFFKGAFQKATMEESCKGEISLENICEKVVGVALVEWIYFGAVSSIVDPKALFCAAAYCDVPSLMTHVGKLMISQCNRDSVSDVKAILAKHEQMKPVQELKPIFLMRLILIDLID